MNIAMIGAGSFGTALSQVLTENGHTVTLWAREPEVAESINAAHRNPAYLTELTLSEQIRSTTDLVEAVQEAKVVVFATPSHTVREVAGLVKPHLRGDELIVSVAKGFERETFLRISQVLEQVLKSVIPSSSIGVLSGPSHAEEVGEHKPTTVVVSANDRGLAYRIQEIFMSPMFRVYVNHDIVGVEIAGAVKNIIAIASGVVAGCGLGENANAALMTRGLHEIKRMGMRLGASQDTFSGLAGMGDLIVTCTSTLSRNRTVGYRIGAGENLADIIDSMNMVAEGVKTTQSVHEWAVANNVDMPITSAIHDILFLNREPQDALVGLMTRDPKEEHE